MSTSDGGDDAQDFAASRAEFIFGDDEDEIEPSLLTVSANEALPEDPSDNLLSYSGAADFYALLGLPRKPAPSDSDIHAAYHRLSVLFHPDKHPAGQQDTAREQFERIQRARDTLIDPKKRVIYDLLGEEGLEREYGIGGSMRHEALGRGKQLGPKAMDAKEFREWFIREMKKRERSALEEMVNSRTGFTVGINAYSVSPSKTNQHMRRWALPKIRVSSFFVRSSFKIPINLTTASNDKGRYGSLTDLGAVQEQNQDAARQIEGHLNVYAGLGGQLRSQKKTFDVRDLDTGQVEKRSVPMPPSIVARSISLGTTVIVSVPDLPVLDKDERWTWQRASRRLINGCHIEAGSQFLPRPSFRLAFNRTFTPITRANSFSLRVQTIFNRLPLHFPPVVNVTMSRPFGQQLTGYCTWNSGSLFWPSRLAAFLASMPSPHSSDETSAIMALESSSFSLGLSGFSVAEEKSGEPDGAGAAKQPAKASWGLEVVATPGGGNLSLNYGRNAFRGQVPSQRVSEWSSEGRHESALEIPHQINAVRLEIETSISVDGSLTWAIRGNRKFGEFTKAGIGIGVQGARGLVVSLNWSRLGQSVNLPVAVCPLKLVDPDVAVAAIALPWLAYSLVFHGILKRRADKQRKEILRRKKRELVKDVSRKKKESEQAIALMRSGIQRRQEKEASQGGLVILCAQYGPCPDPRETLRGNDDGFVDVTMPIAALVQNSQLVLPKSIPKAQLTGFYDPSPMKTKMLRLWYRYAGVEHFVEVLDMEDLICPLRSHQK